MGFKDNIWGADLADAQLIIKFNKGFKVLLCIIDIFSKCSFVVSLKDKKRVSIVDAFQKILDDSNRKPNKIWVDKGSEFYNNSFKKWLKDNDIEMYSIHNEEKSVIAERFIRTLKNKIYKHMTSVSKNMYINKLDDIGMNIIIHIIEQLRRNLLILKIIHILILKIKINDRDSKFKIDDHVRISKYKNIFTKGYMPNWSEEVFVVSKI